jgi:hypothetical protein
MENDGEKAVAGKILEVFEVLALSEKTNFLRNGEVIITAGNGSPIFTASSEQITIPSLPIPRSFFEKPSPLSDNFVPQTQLKSFIEDLTGQNKIRRLNHVGLCYLVPSIDQEKQRLKEEIGKTNWHLYEEESQDLSAWLFLGNKTTWEDPLLEFCPTEDNSDQWKDYWLPHFQIDIDTGLEGVEIENLLKKHFGKNVFPYHLVTVDNYLCIIRARLGSIAGVNINLDLGTAGRPTQYHREKLLKEIV